MIDALNHVNLGLLFLFGAGFAAVCFGIGAALGALANRRRQR